MGPECTRIDNQNVQDILSLTPMQEGMLFHYLRHPEQAAYFEQLALTLRGEFVLERVEQAWEAVIAANEALRTVFRWEKLKKPVQIVLRQVATPVRFFDLEGLLESEQMQRIREIRESDRRTRIDLAREPFRIAAIRLGTEAGVLLLSNHHILFDGWSTGILLKEFLLAYQALSGGQPVASAPKTSLKEYICWLNSVNRALQQRYWAGYLAGFDTPTFLPALSDAGVREVQGGRHTVLLGAETTERLHRFAAEHHLTPATILYAAWGLLLQRYNDTQDVVFGTTVSGRHADIRGVEEMVGLFINTVPLRVNAAGSAQILTALRELDQGLQQRTAYEQVPLVEIKACSELNPHDALFESIVVVENYPLDQRLQSTAGALRIQDYSLEESAEFALALIVELKEQISLTFSYDVQRLTVGLVEQVAGHWCNILTYVLQHPGEEITSIPMLAAAEVEQILVDFNATAVEYPRELTIQQAFEAQVAETPDRTAVVFADTRLSYAELNAQANLLAHQLREAGIVSDALVGIVAARSPEMIVGILAILKAGGAYLPVDPAYPAERIQLMLEDGAVRVLLTQGEQGQAIDFSGCVIDLTSFAWDAVEHSWRENLPVGNTPHSLAYVIYTSGSTGRPKGVMIEHRSVLRLVKNANYFRFAQDDKILQTGTLAFDASTFEIWGALLNGLELHLGEEELILRVELLEEYIREQAIRVLWLTTTLFNVLVDQRPAMFRQLRYLFTGGEAMSPKHANLVRQECPDLKLVNCYGPTENTTFSTYFPVEVEFTGNIPIGRPISNSTAYLFDHACHLVPVGVADELCVGGDGLARGYLQNPALTTEKFVPNPLVPGTRMYRTGDRARWLPDGNLEFLGRIDQQVKIRGFRIEPGEIENCLLRYSPVREATVLDRVDANGSKYLCAYVVAEGELAPGEVREYLSRNLPAYMIPTHFVQLEQMPLNRNGKLDRQALPEPDGNADAGSYLPPQTELEQKLVLIWQEVLGVERVGVTDNFFDRGGHSLKATVLASRVWKELDIELPLREIFQRPTIREQAGLLQAMAEDSYAAIPPVPENDYYEVSPAQKRMYMLQQMDLQGTAYNITAAFTVEGELDEDRLLQTLQKLVQRHEPLRTSFHMMDDQVVQRVVGRPELLLEVLQPASGQDEQTQIDGAIADFVRPFVLDEAPLLRVGVMALGPRRALLVFDLHHIIADGTALGVLVQEFTRLYGGEALEPLRIQYKDYAAWQNQRIRAGALKAEEAYWLECYRDAAPVLNLPLDQRRPATPSFVGDTVSFVLEEALTRELSELARRTGSTLYMVLLTGFQIMLAKYSGQDDLVVGSPVAGRRHADLEALMGMFVNTLAIRAFPVAEKTYSSFLAEVREQALRAFEHQDYQFEELVEVLQIERELSRNPLFDVMFVLQNMEQGEFVIPGLQLKSYSVPGRTAKMDLTLLAREGVAGIYCELEYSQALFYRETICRMAEHFAQLLRAIVAAPESRLGTLEMLTEAERSRILHEFAGATVEDARQATLPTLWEAQVVRTPDAIAVVSDRETLTYRELDQRASHLATVLRAKGVRPSTIVGIALERSVEMLVGIYGILKAGGAYLPVSPAYPVERFEYLLEDSQTPLLLTVAGVLPEFAFAGEVLDLAEILGSAVKCAAGGGHDCGASVGVEPAKPADLAYVIYTSGSTGKPKGVLVEHRSVVNVLTQLQQEYPLEADGTYLLKTAFTFDVSVAELFGWFHAGGRIALLPPAGEKDPRAILRAIAEHRVTHLNFVPSMLHVFLMGIEDDDVPGLQTLQYIMVAGEAFPVELARRCQARLPWVRVENIYGPTETTIYVTRHSTHNGIGVVTVPIGKPFPNVRAYILNHEQDLQPIGIAGELCIGGECLARGYLNRSELTEEKFVENPYEPGQLMYRTGDLVRWLADGTIEFLGRIDQQVKIRGFRIEPGEIQNQLLQHGAVQEAIVIDREEQDGSKYLCAYFVAERQMLPEEMREYLLQSLPEYMVPAYFVQLEQLPLNTNGKVDRRALPEPGQQVAGREYVAPANALEERLASIWAEVLGLARVGTTDHFFECGGHSLKATILAGRLQKETGVEISLGTIFKYPTIKELSAYIQRAVRAAYLEIAPIAEQEYYATSSAQKRMYMLQQLDLETTSYNMPIVLEIRGKLEIERVKHAFCELSKRHETLRTSYATVGEAVVQKIVSVVDVVVEVVDLNDTMNPAQGQVADGETAVDSAEGTARKFVDGNTHFDLAKALEDFVRPFDLSQAPLWRVRVVCCSAEQSYLMLDLHHSIADGTSLAILVDEFTQLYKQRPLSTLRVQYKDFAAWQNAALQSDRMKEQEAFWLGKFSGEIPVLHLPTDFPRPAHQSFEGSQVSIRLTEELSAALKQLAQESDSTLYMVLLSAVTILLAKYSGQEDLVVGSPVAGRLHPDLERIVGMFVNTLALRNQPAGAKCYAAFLQEVKANTLEALANQEYQFDELVELLQVQRDLSRNPLFGVLFVMQNIEGGQFGFNDLQVEVCEVARNTAKMDLILGAMEIDSQIKLDLEYSKALFHHATIERILGHLTRICEAITSNPQTLLHQIDMLTEDERREILVHFNDTTADYPQTKSLHEAFAEQVEWTPERIAVLVDGASYTYREIQAKATRVAQLLRSQGVQGDSIVAIRTDRSLEMVAGILGILQAGGAYLPLAPDYPLDRTQYMLEDSQTRWLVAQPQYAEVPGFTGNVLELTPELLETPATTELEPLSTAQNLAYVIYTSGSTGRPKGVLVEHRSVFNILTYLEREYPLGDAGTYLLKTAYTFDVSVTELFGWFMGGGRLAILPPFGEKDAGVIMDAIDRYQVTHLNFVPSMLQVFLEGIRTTDQAKLQSLQYLFVAGEAFPRELVNRCRVKLPHVAVENIYGPTEATIYVTRYRTHELGEEAIVPVGKSVANTQACIVSPYMELQAVGVPGELCVGGDCLARGYLRRPELNAEKFVPNPFTPGKMMYRTGDLARWKTDGNIEFLGRIDQQVKIRGFRIEPGEIESQLLRYEPVQESVVVAKTDPVGAKYLCAYIVAEREVTVRELREALLENLPEYMVPTYFVQLEAMPLNANGKVDRKALPKPDGSRSTGREYVAPRNQVEARLVEIWSEVLGIERIGIADHFFELGGHSLKATLLSAKIHQQLQVEVALREIFQRPTVQALAQYIMGATASLYSSIQPVAEQEDYPASAAQKRLYIQNQLAGGDTSYNLPGAVLVEGTIDLQRIEWVFQQLIRRHETLRTSFVLREGQVRQRVAQEVEFALELLSGVAKEVKPLPDSTDVAAVMREFLRPFDLSVAPLCRVGVAPLGVGKELLVFDLHHIIADGVSLENLIREFVDLYQGVELSPLRVQYKDFAVWQQELFASEVMEKQRAFWLETFAGEIPVLNLRTDQPRPPIQSYRGDSLNTWLDAELAAALQKLAAETGATLYMVLLAAFQVLLARYTGQDDLVVGTPVAGRRHADLEPLIGMFVNMLPLRNQPRSTHTYREFLREVNERTLAVFDHQDYPLEELLEALRLERDLSRNPLFDVVFALQDASQRSKLETGRLRLTPCTVESRIAKFDLTLEAIMEQDGLWLSFEYCTDLFQRETVERLADHYITLLREMTQNPDRQLWELEMLSSAEKCQILQEFNNTAMDFPAEQTLHALISAQVARTPERIAVVAGERRLTYKELNARANRLAYYLRECGVQREEIIGIMAERSVEMLIGMLGVLKAGGAYLPLDLDYPVERLRYMLKDSETRILLTRGEHAVLEDYDGLVIDLREFASNYQEGTEMPGQSTHFEKTTDLAYVMYTSGSTGKPKGVLIEHRGVVNLSYYYNELFALEQKRILHMSNVSFDTSVVEIFPPLIFGGTIYILAKELVLDRRKFATYVRENQIQFAQFVPMLLQALLAGSDSLTSLETVIVGGDVLDDTLKEQTLALGYPLTNHYGPTESTVDAVVARCEAGVSTIGKPIANTRVYILDREQNLTPVGVPGELCIAGIGLARGYLNRPELTAEKFIANPWVPDERIYRTGDLACWQRDGSITFLGRIDHQVKIRGFRVELEEIETRLLEHPAVRGAAVLMRDDGKRGQHLCAYVTLESAISSDELKAHLAAQLPGYMIPAYIIPLTEMPLTPTGKIDRRALPEPEAGDARTGYVAPANHTEAKLVQLWEEILGVEGIGREHHFFEMGGHSLKAAALIARIHQEFHVEVPLSAIFTHPTIAGLATYIAGASQSIYAAIEPVEAREYYPTSSAEQRIYILQQMAGAGTTYNMPGALQLTGPFSRERCVAAVEQLIARHEALRTTFVMVDGEILRQVLPVAPFTLETLEVQADQLAEQLRAFQRPFDLGQAPLFRVGLGQIAEECHVLVFDLHHIISDGVSMEILTREFMTYYEGQPLPPLRIQYKDFAAWQMGRSSRERISEQEQYWLTTFAGELPVLNLPVDHPRPAVQSFAGSSISFSLDVVATGKLRTLARETGVTLYMLLLACYNLLLARYSGQEDLVVGSPVAGRPHADLQQVMGVFINTLALRNRPQVSQTCREWIAAVRATTLKAFEHQEYPFEQLVEQLEIPRDLSRNPLFDTMLILQNTGAQTLTLDGVQWQPLDLETGIAKLDLTLTAEEAGDEVHFYLEYCRDLFERSTIERLVEHFTNIIHAVTDGPEKTLAEIEMLSAAEKALILWELNRTEVELTPKTIQQLFEEQVERTPDLVAFEHGAERLTYRELNEQANRLARALRAQGVTRETMVGLMLRRTPLLMVSILGILKAGGGYLPLDPEYPAERITYIIEDSGARFLLTTAELGSQVSVCGQVLYVEDLPLAEDCSNLPPVATPADMLYMIYTSGSSGKPKGVILSHYSAQNLFHSTTQMIDFTEGMTVLCLTTISFDIFLIETLYPLTSGGRVVLADENAQVNPAALAELIETAQIDLLQATPSRLGMIINSGHANCLQGLRTIILGGEALPEKLLRELQRGTKARIFNMYGPSETTVYSVTGEMTRAERVVIGKPVANTTVRIVDGENRLQPVGIAGELCISGAGLARGYHQRPELTVEKFVPDPWGTGACMYRSGDLARWLPDGNIEYLGRIDQQVKIRGFRIEPGEIENQLLRHPTIRDCAVVARGEAANKYLAAYLVADEELGVPILRAHLAQELPEYMIPSYFVQMESLPLTPSGKTDRRALPEPTGQIEESASYAAPTNSLEAQLLEIWQQVLGVEGIGIRHNFFALGGHSLKAVQILNQVQRSMQVQVTVQELFTAPTVEELAKRVQQAGQSTGAAITPLFEQADYALSYNQQRLWIVSQREPASGAYNIPGQLSFAEPADVELIRRVLAELATRHESLRTTFQLREGRAVQVIADQSMIPLEIYDLRQLQSDAEKARREEIAQAIANAPFTLLDSPLIRVALIITGEAQFEIVFCMHHIISDGWSLQILKDEFYQLYMAARGKQECHLPALTVGYKDFAAWQHRWIADAEQSGPAREYWLAKLRHGFPDLHLPTDYPAQAVTARTSAGYRVFIPQSLQERLMATAQGHNTSLFIVLTTVLQLFLADLTGMEEVAIGVPSSGRQHEEISQVIGFFVNTIILVSRVSPGVSFADMLALVHEDTMKALQYQDYPLELVTDELQIKYPQIKVFFNLLNMGETHLEKMENMATYHIPTMPEVKFELVFYLTEYANGIELICTYLTGLYKPSTIEYLINEYLRLVAQSVGLREELESVKTGCENLEDDDDDLILVRG